MPGDSQEWRTHGLKVSQIACQQDQPREGADNRVLVGRCEFDKAVTPKERDELRIACRKRYLVPPVKRQSKEVAQKGIGCGSTALAEVDDQARCDPYVLERNGKTRLDREHRETAAYFWHIKPA